MLLAGIASPTWSLAAQASDPRDLIDVGGILYYTAATTAAGRELWRSDGTPEGTAQVIDLDPGPDSPFLRFLTAFDGDAYFVARGPDSRERLWRSDGTAAGTRAITGADVGGPRDVNPGPMAVLGAHLYFSAHTSASGFELWRTDGTPEGTTLVVDLAPGGASSSPENLTATASLLYFTARGGGLWASDGTPEGTARLDEGRVSSVFSLTAVGDILYFAGADESGYEPWRSDGTADGTYQLRDIYPGALSSSPAHFTAVGDQIFFVALDEIWVSDGTPDGTVCLCDIAASLPFDQDVELVGAGGLLYFVGEDPEHGRELWRTDGTPAGTALVADLFPGEGWSAPRHLVAFGDRIYLAAGDSESGSELWSSDGTAEGTYRVADVSLGPASSSPEDIVAVGGRLFFSGHDAITGARRLWSSDGSPGDLVRLSPLPPVPENDLCTAATPISALPFFGITDATLATESPDDPPRVCGETSRNVWFDYRPPEFGWIAARITSPQGASLAAHQGECGALTPVRGACRRAGAEPAVFRTIPGQSYRLVAGGALLGGPEVQVAVEAVDPPLPVEIAGARAHATNGALYLALERGTDRELWLSDGTAAGTRFLSALVHSGGERRVAVLDQNRVVFTGTQFLLHVSQGTIETTAPFETALVVHSDFAVWRGAAYFTASPQHGSFDARLWRTDGTAAGTTPVKGISNSLPDLVAFDHGIVFVTGTGTSGDLWRSDGTEAGTIPLRSGTIDPFGPRELTPAGGVVYFSANDVGGRELWRTDGTRAGTIRVADLFVGGSADPQHLTWAGDTLYFTADDGHSGRELWRSDGTAAGTRLVRDIRPGVGSSVPQGLSTVDGVLYFTADDGVAGRELWRSDGSADGTTLLRDIEEGGDGSFPATITGLGHRFLFVASTSELGREPWISDGTTSGTRLLRDIEPGRLGSSPFDLAAAGGSWLFVTRGELWRSDGSAAGTVPYFRDGGAVDLNCDAALSAADLAGLMRVTARPNDLANCAAADSQRASAIDQDRLLRVVAGVFGRL